MSESDTSRAIKITIVVVLTLMVLAVVIPLAMCVGCTACAACAGAMGEAAQQPRCGDGFRSLGIEACDDGNRANGDGCSSQCQLEPGAVPPGGALPSCGNGVVEPGEQCDDGNTRSGDGCSEYCMF